MRKFELTCVSGIGVVMDIRKFPRTQHVEGSRLQKGDEDLEQVPLKDLYGKHLVIEEKQDGANSGISFVNEALKLQSRGHYLQGGPRETRFTLFKQWATTHSDDFYLALGDRYIAYGEWLYKKHTVFYDALKHFWAEFDIYDRSREVFLDTASRCELLNGVRSCPVSIIWQGTWTKSMRFEDFVRPSLFKTARWKENLRDHVAKLGFDWNLVRRPSSNSCDSNHIRGVGDSVGAAPSLWSVSTLRTASQARTHWNDHSVRHGIAA